MVMFDDDYSFLNDLYTEQRSKLSIEEIKNTFRSEDNSVFKPQLFTLGNRKRVELFKNGFLALGLCIKSFQLNDKYIKANIIFSPQTSVNENLGILYDIRNKINDFCNDATFKKLSLKEKKLYNDFLSEQNEPKMLRLSKEFADDHLVYLSAIYINNFLHENPEDKIIPIIFNPKISKYICQFPLSLINTSKE